MAGTRQVRQDLIHVNPLDFKVAYAQFKQIFNDWAIGFDKWGNYHYSITFVQDKSIKRGTMIGVSPLLGTEVEIKILNL